MNEMQLAVLRGQGYAFKGLEKRGTKLVAIAIKPRPDGKGTWKAEADGISPREAERNLILTITRR